MHLNSLIRQKFNSFYTHSFFLTFIIKFGQKIKYVFAIWTTEVKVYNIFCIHIFLELYLSQLMMKTEPIDNISSFCSPSSSCWSYPPDQKMKMNLYQQFKTPKINKSLNKKGQCNECMFKAKKIQCKSSLDQISLVSNSELTWALVDTFIDTLFIEIISDLHQHLSKPQNNSHLKLIL